MATVAPAREDAQPALPQPPVSPGPGMMRRRLEVKYLIDRTRRTALERDVQALMRLDRHGGPDGSYIIRSLYLDTPDYMAYHEKMAGVAARHKLRLRAYGAIPEQDSRMVRLEVKSRYLEFIFKTTADITRADYPSIADALRSHTLPPERLMAERGVREFFRLKRLFNMEPNVLLQYRRRAYERREMGRVRVSFDDEIVSSPRLDLLGPLVGGRSVLQPGHTVFEIKADGWLPFWLHALIGKYDLGNEAFSKYCYAVRNEARLSAKARENLL